MFMYISFLLEMSVCTSGRFLNFPRQGAASPEGQIHFCCKAGGVLPGKQLPWSTRCSPSLQLEWKQGLDPLPGSAWALLVFASLQLWSWHRAIIKPAMAFGTRLTCNSDWPIHFASTHYSGVIAALPGSQVRPQREVVSVSAPGAGRGCGGSAESTIREHILLPLLRALSHCEHLMLHGATRSQERNISLM